MKKRLQKKIVVVGNNEAGNAIASLLIEQNPANLLGFVCDQTQSDVVMVPDGNGGMPCAVLGRIQDLNKIVKKYGAHNVVVALDERWPAHLLSQLVVCYEQNITVVEMADLYSKIAHKIPVQHVHHEWIMPHLTAPTNSIYTLVFEGINYVLSLFGFLFCFLPLFPFISLLIKLESRGPIFYRQNRVGKNGKIFNLVKFRTMYDNAENGKPQWAKQNDYRITKVGRWLRKFRLDEMPQFLSVLKGEMSLIGPRPERPEFVDKLTEEIPFYQYRHLVKPGITGWAQVKYRYGNTIQDSLEKVQYDLYWIKNRSFSLDFGIILRSIKVILTGFGAL